MKKLTLLMSAILLANLGLFAQIKFVCMGNSISHGSYKNHPVYAGTSIGDSLAEMSYRFWLWEKLDSAGVNAVMVGFNHEYFDQWGNTVKQHSRYNTSHNFRNEHEAYYGITTDGFLTGGGWNHDSIIVLPTFDVRVNSYTADVALIDLGTNDNDGIVNTTEANIKTIITKLRGKNPNITVLLTVLTNSKAINARMPGIANETTTGNSIVYCVSNMPTGFNSGTMTLDGTHPNALGQKFMAQRWYDAYMLVTKADAVAPAIPSGLAVSNVKATTVDLSWSASTDNTGINVYNIYANDVLVASTGALTYTVTGLAANTAYTFKITAADYKKNESGKSTGVNATTLIGYDVTLIVNDGTSTLLQDAEVTFATVKKLTDVAGKAVYIDQTTGNNTFQIVKKGYKTVSGTVNLTKDTTVTYSLLPDCSILFTVADGINKIAGAKITINATNLTTDASGQATFNSLKPGSISYTVTYKGYKTVSDTITITDDTTVNVPILPDCLVLFVVTDGTNPLQNAMVNFTSNNRKTDVDGNATFADRRPGTYTYYIKLMGYVDNTKDVTIVDDTTFNIVMIKNQSSLEESTGILVHPNPADNIINIANANGSAYEIIDISGKVLLKGVIVSSLFTIDISSLDAGNYFVRISKGQVCEVKNIFISK